MVISNLMIYKVTTKLIDSTLLIAKSNAKKKKRRTKRASQSTAFTNSKYMKAARSEESCSLEGKSTIQLNKIEYGIRGSP